MSFLSVKKMDKKQAIYVFSFKISKKKKKNSDNFSAWCTKRIKIKIYGDIYDMKTNYGNVNKN